MEDGAARRKGGKYDSPSGKPIMYNARMSTPPAHPQLQALRDIVTCCTLCPRRCRVNRTIGEVGRCGIGAEAVIVSAGAHFGEEACLSGPGGSGTIFFAGCNLAC